MKSYHSRVLSSILDETVNRDEWAPPIPFDEYKVPGFPSEALPSWLARFVTESSRSLQVPIDLMAMLSLASIATCSATKFEVQIKDRYTEPMNLFTLVALPPGNRKSAAVTVATAPIFEYEQRCAAAQYEANGHRQAKRGMLKKGIAYAEGKAARAISPEEQSSWMDRVSALTQELGLAEAPVNDRLLIEDATPQRLANLLGQHGRIASISAESGSFVQLATSKTGLDILLRGHAGDPIRVDRLSRAGDFVDQPAITLALTAQPSVLSDLAKKPAFRGRGLLGRFLYSMPKSPLGLRDVNPPAISDEAVAEYRNRLLSLLALNGETMTVYLTMEAREAWLTFSARLEPRLGDDGDLQQLSDWASKLCGAVARIAGLLHVADHGATRAGTTPVTEQTMVNACDIGEYCIEHAKAAFGEMGADGQSASARRVVDWLREHATTTAITARDLFQGVRGTLPTMTKLRPVLALLEEHGFIRVLSVVSANGPGRPSKAYALHPSLLARRVPGAVRSARVSGVMSLVGG